MSPERLYLRRFTFGMIGYVVVLFASQFVMDRLAQDNWLRYLVAVLPVLPIMFGAFAYLRFIRDIDELQRRIQLDGISFGFALTSIITVILGFLEVAGMPKIGMIWVFPILVGLWGVGTFLANRRYR